MIARRRHFLGFHRPQERFISAAEMRNVYREGNSVRVDLRGDSDSNVFFRFWAEDALAAATIVRLLPTTRTIEFDEAPRDAPSSTRWPIWPALWTVLVLALLVPLTWFAVDLAHRHWPWRGYDEVAPASQPMPRSNAPAAAVGSALPRPSESDILFARMELQRFDARIDGLTTQFSLAFTALQIGNLSQRDFADGLEKWLIPQWDTLKRELLGSAP